MKSRRPITALVAVAATSALVASPLGSAAGEPSAGNDDRPASVEEVRIAPATDGTVVTVRTGGDVRVSHFALDDPPRLVVDLEGARHALPRFSYEEIGRGGVVRMRTSQFRDQVVRLVLELTERPRYRVDESEGRIEVRLTNPHGGFEPWSTGGGGSPASGVEAGRDGTRPEARGGARPQGRAPAGVRIPSGGGARGGAAGGLSSSLPPLDSGQEQPRITVTYDEASMQDVLAAFSDFTGMSIVPSSEAAEMSVRGVSITDQPWDLALEAILSAQGLGWKQSGPGIIIVDDLESLATRDTLRTETRVMKINYASADSVASVLRNLATPEKGQVVAYEGANSVIVTDRPGVVSRMDSLVSVLDTRTPQVSIEAKIIFVDRTDVNELGIVYDFKDAGTGFNTVVPTPGEDGDGTDGDGDGEAPQAGEQPFAVRLGGDAIAALANANDRIANPSLRILANTVFAGFSLTGFVEALRTEQLSDVEAAPSIQVVDNHQAYVQVGERTPIRILERGAQLEEAQVNVQFEDTGIILQVTPHITNNNQVLMDLEAQRSGLRVGLSDVGFNFDRQVGRTRLLLGDGETGAIAGLTLSEVSRSESGIPLFMDIPFLGKLFRTTKTNERKQDLIILVTPHIVEPGLSAGLGSS